MGIESPECVDNSGETREEAVQLGLKLQSQGITPMLQYSKESSDSAVDIEHTETEIIKCIEAAANLKKPAFVAIKLSGLATAKELRCFERDHHDLMQSHGTASPLALNRIMQIYPELCERTKRIFIAAARNQVYVVLDAEIRYQDGVDTIETGALLAQGVAGGAVWNTHQM